MHARLLIVVGLSLLSCGDVFAGPITPHEVRPPRGVRPTTDQVPSRAVTSNLTDLSWQGAGEVHLASAGGIDCLSPGIGVVESGDPAPCPAMADGRAVIQAWVPGHSIDPLFPVPAANNTPAQVGRTAEVTELTH